MARLVAATEPIAGFLARGRRQDIDHLRQRFRMTFSNVGFVGSPLHLTEHEAKALQPLSVQGLEHQTWIWMNVPQPTTHDRVHEYVRMVLPRLGQG